MFKSQAELKPETLGTGRLFDTGIYPMVVDMAYLDQSTGGAHSLTVTLKSMDGKTLKETLWITGGKAKGQLTYFLNKNGDKQDLPGFAIANAISALSTGKELGDHTPEEKMVNVFNYDLKKEVPTAKQVFVALIGQKISVAIQKQIVDKTAKAADGSYQPTGETREQNEIVGVYNTDTNQNMYEAKNSIPAEFHDKWLAANAGKTRDKSSKSKPAVSSPTSAPAKSLFGN